MAPQVEVLQPAILEDGERHATLGIATERPTAAIGERPVVLDQPFEGVPGEVEPVESRVAAFEPGNHREGLGIVIEAAVVGQTAVKRALAGVTERRMAEVVRERGGLGEILVETERTGERAGDLGHLKRMREPRAVMVALVEHKHLSLVSEPPEGVGVDNAVTIAAKVTPRGARGFRIEPAAPRPRFDRIGRTGACHFSRHATPGPISFLCLARFLPKTEFHSAVSTCTMQPNEWPQDEEG